MKEQPLQTQRKIALLPQEVKRKKKCKQNPPAQYISCSHRFSQVMLFMFNAVVSKVTKATKLKNPLGTWIFWQRIMSPYPAVNEQHRRHRGRDKPAAWEGWAAGSRQLQSGWEAEGRQGEAESQSLGERNPGLSGFPACWGAQEEWHFWWHWQCTL